MMHRICDRCGEMESVDFMVRIDDNFYCTECDQEQNEEINTKGKTGNENQST